MKADTGLKLHDSTSNAVSTARNMLLGALALTVVFSLTAGFFIARQIKNGVAVIASRLDSITTHCVTALETGSRASNRAT